MCLVFFYLEFSGNVGNKRAVVKKTNRANLVSSGEKCSEDMHDVVAPGEDSPGGL